MTPLCLRLMTLEDISQVASLEKRVFTVPWSPRTYAYEVTESDSSHMVVLASAPPVSHRASGLMRLLNALGYSNEPELMVLSYGGLWNLIDEAHISTIASHPEYRGKGYGEAALAGMMRRAIVIGASYVALEVRVSNIGAQALYRKYGFDVHGTKHRYYLDNNEDAYDMRLHLGDQQRRAIEQHYRTIQSRLGFSDAYTEATHNL